jgi:hypothetical protein
MVRSLSKLLEREPQGVQFLAPETGEAATVGQRELQSLQATPLVTGTRYAAPVGKHDDGAIARMVAVQMAEDETESGYADVSALLGEGMPG